LGGRSSMATEGGGLMNTTPCPQCLRRAEVADDLHAGDLSPEEWRTLRRRIEEAVRKSPAALHCAAVALAAVGHIRIDDLVKEEQDVHE
jgi:uncharacterized phage protein gp47/JayE